MGGQGRSVAAFWHRALAASGAILIVLAIAAVYLAGGRSRGLDLAILAGPAGVVLLGVGFLLSRRSAAGAALEELNALSPLQFVEWVAARFRERGYTVRSADAYRGEGADLIAEKPGEMTVIQCANGLLWPVDERALWDLYRAMRGLLADHACLVATGRVTHAARVWASGKPIEIWDGKHLAHLSLQRGGRTRTAQRAPTAASSLALSEVRPPQPPTAQG